MPAQKKIVTIGGGTGTFTVLRALRETSFHLSAIVSTADDGGSTGILRDELGVLPPGDARQALVALADDTTRLRDLFGYRFEEGSLRGHSFGNLLISALEKVTGRFDEAILEASRILATRGQVIPVTESPMTLRAQTSAGEVIDGEHAIEEHLWSRQATLEKFWVEPPCSLHPLAAQAIKTADLIVIAPGSIYTSLIPCLLVDGMRHALSSTRAKIVSIANLMTEKGQAEAFWVQDFVALIERYLDGTSIDYVLYNTKHPSSMLLSRYKQERERVPVLVDPKRKKQHYRLVGAPLIANTGSGVVNPADQLAATRTLIRHDPKRLARALTALMYLDEAERFVKP
jgi:uncharacterized cofD-like protein